MDDVTRIPSHDRRAFLAGAIALVATACTGSDDDRPAANGTTTSPTTEPSVAEEETAATTDPTSGEGQGSGQPIEPLTAATFAGVSVCAMAPAQGAGPFPSIEQLDRRDITEGYPGHPLRLGLRVVDGGCRPVAGAQVEIWHADATGDYSSYEDGGSGKDEGAGTTFLRGIQTADGDGIIEFQTIYPGWYEGRAIHIHAIASVDGEAVVTTQLYLDEAYTEMVSATGEYARFGPPDTNWADDPLIGNPSTDGSGILLSAAPTSLGDGTLGLINLGIDV